MAVGVLTVLLEGALVEKLEAEGTVEVLRMPLLTHSSDAFAYYNSEMKKEALKYLYHQYNNIIVAVMHSNILIYTVT
jgi:hypothetical protein